MTKKLAVIFGAGASHSQNLAGKPTDRQGYRPPLTKDLFAHTTEFAPILHKYPLAEVLASEIKREIQQDSTIGLEQILKKYERRLKSGEDTHVTREFLQVPFYLNDLLGEVSRHFTHQSDEYNTLVNRVLDSTDEVLFLTLNYDTLLEVPLSSIDGSNFSKLDHYLANPKWSLVKLHGSTNWYRRFNSYQMGVNQIEDCLTNLRSQPLPLSLGDDFVMVGIPGHQTYYEGRAPLYPALTIPIDGKYEYNCPQQMILEAKRLLKESKNYLIVGTSGHDKDLLDLLKENASAENVLVIGVSEESVEQTRANFALGVPQLNSKIRAYHNTQGFSGFMNGPELDAFLKSLR